ncbi:hypothetical protein ABT127_29445 [Streptomyces sp. NPDC001904]|uniref:hypothetical protein n=1 Tax=Streptomyces sp. NPDC001904 TaxID=3154531 RepID=UPI0033316461
MPIAHPVPFLGRGEENVGATVVGVVDGLHPGVEAVGDGAMVVLQNQRVRGF